MGKLPNWVLNLNFCKRSQLLNYNPFQDVTDMMALTLTLTF